MQKRSSRQFSTHPYLLPLFCVCVWLAASSSDSLAHEDDYLSTELHTEVEQLKQAVEQMPTTLKNMHARVDVFWRWANAYVTAGRPIDPDVPTTVARLRDPGAETNASAEDLADVDRWVREFTYREKNPKAIGSLASPKLTDFQVDQFHSLVITYTVGARPLGPGDGFVLGELTYGKGQPTQLTSF